MHSDVGRKNYNRNQPEIYIRKGTNEVGICSAEVDTIITCFDNLSQ